MKKFCATALLSVAALSAASIDNATTAKQTPAPVSATTQIVLEAARAAKNVAVNLNTMDPKKVTMEEFTGFATPEPGTNLLIGGALVGLAALGRRRKKKSA